MGASGKQAAQPTDPGDSFAVTPPAIQMPKGGGAIRGMGEKFAANPVTGTGSTSVPIATSPGRGGFGPQLSLAYDSGAGNGPFGFGWSLSLPQIARKTDKGLPRYNDAGESDVFLLSGAEDLVPVLVKNGEQWERETLPPRVVGGTTYQIDRYRPRIEGLFARIERWTNTGNPADVHWRSLSKDNILTLYGKDETCRIMDPADASHIFSWLICETRDDKGNAVLYKYKAEDGTNLDLAQAHEANRGPVDDKRRQTNCYLKHIFYGNRKPLLDATGRRPAFLTPAEIAGAGWMFEVVFDYGEHDVDAPTPGEIRFWPRRSDPFSAYRAGFEVRTYRLCQRVLMFHHFPEEQGVGADCLVRSTDLKFSQDAADGPIYSFLISASHSGYVRQGAGYLKRSLPPVEFEYTRPVVQTEVEEVDAESLENLPAGLGGAGYQWTDLHGEGIPGILTEQAGAWFYKRNLSPINVREHGNRSHLEAQFAPVELVAARPNLSLAGGAQFMDLAGDGQPDLVVMDGPLSGLYEHDEAESWGPFRPFNARLSRAMSDPNLRFVDLDGDGHADVLITEDDAFVWHPSLAEDGFGSALRVAQALDEERGPRLVFADGEGAVYLADLSGDGLTDLARIRNGEVCYWPNLGYGRFGAKVTMDNSPVFDSPEQFDQKRVRLADIDGSGTTDIIYLHRDGVRLFFNQSGNGWGQTQTLNVFPQVDSLTDVVAADLLGNGTASLVWSSPLAGDAGRQMRYVNLMGDEKPHLLVRTVNNLGAETRVRYAPSTRFYLQDKVDGRPWITRLPFPVHVVERVETFDAISRNRFVTRYAYHHGFFDGEEREFRGFGMVEQFDTEEFASLTAEGELPTGDNVDAASHVPPVLTRTWFHTGVYLGRDHVSDFFAGLLDGEDKGEYYREPELSDEEAKKLLLPDTILPDDLSLDEEREAARSLKGMMLRQEVYALDGIGQSPDYPFGHPYTVAEQSFAIRPLQPRGGNPFAVFFTHPDEAITYHYEREPGDPRIQHALTLEVDGFGNVLKAAAIGYGRRVADPALPAGADRLKQTTPLLTYSENDITNAIDTDDDYRTPLPAEARTYELTGYLPTGAAGRFQRTDFVEPNPADPARLAHIHDGEVAYEAAPPGGRQRRLIEHLRTRYRPDDLGAAAGDPLALLPQGALEPLALPGESYKLALTPGLIEQVFQRNGQPLLPTDPGPLLESQDENGGGYVAMDGGWWIPSGRAFFAPDPNARAPAELAEAQAHFYLTRRYRDPFGQIATVDYDGPADPALLRYDLLVTRTEDAVHNVVRAANDYRVLAPRLMTDPNGNRAEVAFDVLGMVAGSAVMGKVDEPDGRPKGDSLENFAPDLTPAELDAFIAQPRRPSANPEESEATGIVRALLKDASTRIVYDLDRFRRLGEPPFAATIVREKHLHDLDGGEQSKLQLSFSYSDGFGREIQKKIQAEPGPVPQRDGTGKIIVGANGQPVMTLNEVSPRWVGSGWTVFNNKGKPVRQYEPFFSDTHAFEFGVEVGVSPVLFYDPAERVIATLHPNHSWEKVVFDPWQQTTYDVNDTVTFDPQLDADVRGFFTRLPDDDYLPTWHAQRSGGGLGQDERNAALRAEAQAGTPTAAHFDALGRPFLTVARNRVVCQDHPLDGKPDEDFRTRVELDIEGNQRAVLDERRLPNAAGLPLGNLEQRIIMRYDYDMLGNRIHQASMEAGERWLLNDVSGKPIRAWDSRGHEFRSEYDPLRRPVRSFVIGADPDEPTKELLTARMVYGEQHPEAEARNLRGRVYLALDQAGAVSSELHDFKGNPLSATRRLASEYKQALDWRTVDAVLPSSTMATLDLNALETALAPLLDDETFTSHTTFDALNRPLLLTTPHSSAMKPNTIRPGYNEANLLERIDANLRREQTNGEPVWTPFVTDIDYDAKGQRTLIDYGNGVRTDYTYDPLTFRLVHLLTRRNPILFADDCQQPPPAGFPGCQVQNLRYTYDPAGNITHIQDDAQQTIFFRNQRVEPSADYTYDAVYRLIQATGREHLGQAGGAPIPHSHDDAPRVGLLHPADGDAMGAYIEDYVYDAVGNFLEMQHRGSGPTNPGWTRDYTYSEPGLLEAGKTSNRLSSTTIGTQNSQPVVEPYAYDAHGNMLKMPHLPLMQWDYRDQLQATSQQVVNLGTPEITYYVYDAAGQRARKVTERAVSPIRALLGGEATRKTERIYLGGFEIYREYAGDGATVTLERETLHIMDDQQRIALVETRTQGVDGSPAHLVRFQLGNHLGSASLELDDQAQIISYEEYFPYGSTSYQAVRKDIEVPAKRYRYTGMERDEENGLNYHRARYYAPWLARWISADKSGLIDGSNLYIYSRDSPVRFIDLSGRDALDDWRNSEYNRALASKKEWDAAFQENVKETEEWIEEDRKREREIKSRPFGKRLVLAEIGAKGKKAGGIGRLSADEVWFYGLENGLFHDTEVARVYKEMNQWLAHKKAQDEERWKREKIDFEIKRTDAVINGMKQATSPLPIIQGTLVGGVGTFGKAVMWMYNGYQMGQNYHDITGCLAGTGTDCDTVAFMAVVGGVTRVAPYGFKSYGQFQQFGQLLHGGLKKAGLNDAQGYLMGSAVTGRSFRTGVPFDVGRVSDFDVAITSPAAIARAEGLGIKIKGTRTGPLTDVEVSALGLSEVREKLSRVSGGREVNFMLFDSENSVRAKGDSLWIPSR